MVTAYQGGQVDAHRPVRRPVRRSAASTTRTSTSSTRRGDAPSPDLDALRHGPVRGQAGPPGAGLDVRSAGAHPAAVQGQGASSATTTSSGRATRTSTRSVPQRAQDIAKAKQLLADAGRDRPDGDPPRTASSTRSRTSRSCSRARPRQAGITLNAGRSRASTRSTARSGARPSRPIRRAPAPPSSASSTTATAPPRTSTSTRRSRPKGIWNSSQYSSPAFDAAFKEFQTAVGVDAQKAACTKIETILNEDSPIGHPVLLQLPVRQLEEVHGRLHVRPRADVPLGGVQAPDHRRRMGRWPAPAPPRRIPTVHGVR